MHTHLSALVGLKGLPHKAMTLRLMLSDQQGTTRGYSPEVLGEYAGYTFARFQFSIENLDHSSSVT
jgi:hypothetical protein